MSKTPLYAFPPLKVRDIPDCMYLFCHEGSQVSKELVCFSSMFTARLLLSVALLESFDSTSVNISKTNLNFSKVKWYNSYILYLDVLLFCSA